MAASPAETFSTLEVLKLVAENQHKISMCEGRDIIVCLGRNQGGKSTLYNCLVHGLLDWKEVEAIDPTTGTKQNRLLPLHEKEGFEVAKTGNNINAETVFPCAYKLLDDKVFLDTRGFFDPRKLPMDEAAAAILTDIAVRTARSVRIIWLQPYDAFRSNGVTGIENIGAVFNRIIYDGAPILFLFNKALIPEPSWSKAERKLANDVYETPAGENEKIWPAFQQFALSEIKRIVEYVIQTDHENQAGLFQKVMKMWNGNPPTTLDPLAFANRSKFLGHFHDSLQANRVLFVDPKFEASLSELHKAIDSLPLALAKGSSMSEDALKTLNFSDYCDYLKEFRKRFNSELEVFNALLKARKCAKESLVTEALIETKKMELKKLQQALADVKNEKDLVKYQEQFMGESSISVIVEERNRIVTRISKIDKVLNDIIQAEPFVAVVPFSEFCVWPWKTPSATVVYEDEPFVDFKEHLDPGVSRKKIVSDKPPRFEAIYERVKAGEAKEEPPKDEETLLNLVRQYLPAKVVFCVDRAMDVWSFISSRRCSGRVEFYIESEVHNKQFMEQKEKEKEQLKSVLERKKKEIEQCQEKKALSDAITAAIDRESEKIEKLKKIKQFQEKLQETVQNNISKHGDLSLEEMMERCQQIVVHFFKQKDGIMEEFLRLLNSQSEEIPLDVDTLFCDSFDCAERIKPFFPEFDKIFQ